MVKLDLSFKQILVATGLLTSFVVCQQANALTGVSILKEAEQDKSLAIAQLQPPKNWQNTDLIPPTTDIAPEAMALEPIEAPSPGIEPDPQSEVGDRNQPSSVPTTTSAPFAFDEDSIIAQDLVPDAPQNPPSLEPSNGNSLDLLQVPDGVEIAQGVQTRYRFSYIGIGPNIGITGDPAIGDTSFAVVSRIAVMPRFSARPAVFIEDDVSILLPVTYDFPIAGPGELAPYVGGGLAINTGDENSNVDLLLSAGADYPLNENFAITAGLHAAPFDEFDLGVHVAIAYTFGAVTTTVEPIDLSAVEAEVEETADELGLESRAANPSFIGIGGNIGIGGDTALGASSFAIVSKITIAPSISVRPSLLIEDGVTLLAPVTYDFGGFSTEFLSFYPFIGAGTAVSFDDDDSEFDLLLTAGVDIPITSNLAFTSSINAGLIDSFDIGALLGIVYTFSSF